MICHRWILLACVLIASAAMAVQATTATSPATTRSSAATTQPGAPGNAVRALLLAMVRDDRAAVEAVITPNPDAVFLWSGEPTPPNMLDAVVRSMERLTVNDLVPGDTFQLPNGNAVTVNENMVGPDRRLMVPVFENEPAPLPLVVIRVNGVWKVDASPLIEARKAAQAVRIRSPERQQLQPPP